MKVIFEISTEDFNAIKEKCVVCPHCNISENPTNGDMIKAMFPNAKVWQHEDGQIVYEIEIDSDYSFASYFDGVWWNSLYKKEV